MTAQRVALAYDANPPLPAVDQSRYGPKRVTPIRGDNQKQIAYSDEGGGNVATCLGCGWLRWQAHRRDLNEPTRAHQCPKKKERP